MQDVGIATSRPAEVSRSEGSTTVYLTFRGTRDARSSVDRDTRLRIALASVQAAALWRLLGEHLTDQEKVAADAG